MQSKLAYALSILLLFPVIGNAQREYPAIVYSTLLNAMKMPYEMGALKIEPLTCVYFPEEESSTEFQYNPDDGGKFTTTITHINTKMRFAELTWFGKKQIEPYWSFPSYELGGEVQSNQKEGWIDLKTSGDYMMSFALDGDVFFEFPFSVSVLSGIPNADEIDKYFLDGPWEQYGYLFHLGGRKEMNMKFGVWLRNKERKPRADIKVHGVVTKNGVPFATLGEEPTIITVTPNWKRVEFAIGINERNSEGEMEYKPNMQAKRFLEQDGDYDIRVIVNGESYGVYRFVVKENQIRPIAQQNPDVAKKKELIYGGKDTIWLRRE